MNKEYSIRKEIREEYGNMSIDSIVESLVNFVDKKHESESLNPKFSISRESSVRYPRFSLNILVNGVEKGFNKYNIGRTLERPCYNKFLTKGVLLGDPDMRSQNLRVIDLSSESYKALFTLYNDETSYPTRVKITDDKKLVLPDDGYNLAYAIELGYKVGEFGEVLRRNLRSRKNEYIYELKDNRDIKNKTLEKILI